MSVQALRLLRDLGVPQLCGASDGRLRGVALGARAAARRSFARPIRLPPSDYAAGGVATFAELEATDSVVLLKENRQAFDARCAMVDGALKTVDCALYYIEDDATGRAFATALVRAAERGVTVRLVVDSLASVEKQYTTFSFSSLPMRGSLVLLEELQKRGCDVRLAGGDSWCMHRKFLLADDDALLLGGRNVADHYSTPGWRDLELRFDGPFARSFKCFADATFAVPTNCDTNAKGVLSGLAGHKGTLFVQHVSHLIEAAQHSIVIEHAYVLSLPWLVERLARAVRRGVSVLLSTNSESTNDLPFMNWRMSTALSELADAGVRVFRRRAGLGTLHTKAIVGDARFVVLGSTNLDYYSPTFCAEVDLVIESEDLGRALASRIEQGCEEDQAERFFGTRFNQAGSSTVPYVSLSRICDLILHDLQ